MMRRNLRGEVKSARQAKRYASARTRSFEDWNISETANPGLMGDAQAPVLRNKARILYNDDSHSRGYAIDLERNVLGHEGPSPNLSKAKLSKTKTKRLEDLWREFCHKDTFGVDGKLAAQEAWGLALKTMARDGAVLVRVVTASDVGGRFGLSFQFLELDALDTSLSRPRANGQNQIRAGIELDRWSKVVAYHIREQDYVVGGPGTNTVRITADKIIYGARYDYFSHVHGVTWHSATLHDANQLRGLREATLVSSRLGSTQTGFLIPADGAYIDVEEEEQARNVRTLTPGAVEMLPPGWQYAQHKPENVSDIYGPFEQKILQSSAKGLGVSYATYSNDLGNVNFSSIRAGLVEERTGFKQIQGLMSRYLLSPMFMAWARSSFVRRQARLTDDELNRLRIYLDWRHRGWAWVDPRSDAKANETALKQGLKTRTQIVSEQGGNYEALLRERQREAELEAEILGDKGGSNDAAEGERPEPPKTEETETQQ